MSGPPLNDVESSRPAGSLRTLFRRPRRRAVSFCIAANLSRPPRVWAIPYATSFAETIINEASA